jgi:hypothetical protein
MSRTSARSTSTTLRYWASRSIAAPPIGPGPGSPPRHPPHLGSLQYFATLVWPTSIPIEKFAANPWRLPGPMGVSLHFGFHGVPTLRNRFVGSASRKAPVIPSMCLFPSQTVGASNCLLGIMSLKTAEPDVGRGMVRVLQQCAPTCPLPATPCPGSRRASST